MMENTETIHMPEITADYDYRPWTAPAEASGPDSKRLLDIVLAVIGLVLAAPVMLLIYATLSVAGGAIYAQRRVGRGGKLFHCYKFRSMVHQADQVLIEHLRENPLAQAEWARAQKLSSDPRVTRFGGFLRKTSLDELPQLFNVLKGDMSLVGPRPIVTGEVVRYAGHIRSYYKCRPGITGLWQVSGRNLLSYNQRVALDTLYARKRSMRLDAFILLKTIRVVITGKGAL